VLSAEQPLPTLPPRAVSYLDDGRKVVWRPRVSVEGFACDAERFDRSPREPIVRRFRFPSDPLAFALRWTRAEVRAKLADVPIVSLLRSPNRIECSLLTLILAEEKLVVTVGWAGQCSCEGMS
jgi:hypothetical protein